MPSGLRAIFGNVGLNRQMLAAHLANVENTGSDSYFDHIQRVLPGEMIRFGAERVARRIYWNPDTYSATPSQQRSTGDLTEQYRSLLDSAVGCRIGTHEALGSHLSSGFDSSAVTATAARLIGPDTTLTAFTSAPLAFDPAESIRHRFLDESALAARTAAMHGLPHVIVRETDGFANVVRRQTGLVQAPLWDPINMCWWSEIRRQAAGLGIETILTGEAGNLSLSAGGLGTLAAYVRVGAWRQWWHEARLARRQPGVRWRGIAINSFAAKLPDVAWHAARRLFVGVPDQRSTTFLHAHWFNRFSRADRTIKPTGDPYGDRITALRLGDLGPYRKAAVGDRGIQELDPTADRRLIEFSLLLPPDELLRDGVPKPLARAALADRVPQEILSATRRGLQSADWQLRFDRRTAREMLEEIAADALVQDLLDLTRMEAAIDDWPQEDFNGYRATMTYRNALAQALSTGIFIKQFAS